MHRCVHVLEKLLLVFENWLVGMLAFRAVKPEMLLLPDPSFRLSPRMRVISGRTLASEDSA